VTTITREALCPVVYCPEPTNPDWHHCLLDGNNVIEHHHCEPRGMGGSKSRKMYKLGVVPLCPRHHKEVTEHRWSDEIRETPAGRFYVQIREHEAKAYPLGAVTGEGETTKLGVEAVPSRVLNLPSPAGASGASSDGDENGIAGPDVPVSSSSPGAPVSGRASGPLAGTDIAEPAITSPSGGANEVAKGISEPTSSVSAPPLISESLKPNGLVLPDEFTFEEWTNLAHMVAGMNTNRQWWAGDLILAGERFGERATHYWNGLGYRYESLANCVRVCRRFPRPLRHEGLQFSHHAIVYAQDDKEARSWLLKAQDGAWTVRQLREAVYGRKPKVKRWTVEELKAALGEWPGIRAVRNNGRKYAEAFLETLEQRG